MTGDTHTTDPDAWPGAENMAEQATAAVDLSASLGREETAEYPTLASGFAIPGMGESDLPEGDEDDEWPVKGPTRGIRLAIPTAALIGVLLVAAGFWGGAIAQKNHGTSSSNPASALAARFRSAGVGTTGAGGFSFPGGAGSGGGSAATTGTISVVDGDTLYILTADSALVKVTLGPSTTITRNAKTQAVGLRPGDTVVVQGATGTSGTVVASSVAATAPGVSSSGGSFGGGGFGSGSAGGTSTTQGANGG